MDPILQCQSLTKEYNHFPALSDFSLTLERGQIVGLLGPSGSGKSTLIKLINGLLTPTSGKVLIDGMAPCTRTKEIVSYLPERTYLNDWMKVHWKCWSASGSVRTPDSAHCQRVPGKKYSSSLS